MARGKFVSYLRVSTQRQGRSGLGLEAQRQAVEDYLNGGRWSLVAECVEVESGKRSDRPKLAEALRLCRIHKATLIIAKLDRLARNVAFISNLMELGVRIRGGRLPASKPPDSSHSCGRRRARGGGDQQAHTRSAGSRQAKGRQARRRSGSSLHRESQKGRSGGLEGASQGSCRRPQACDR